MISSQTAIQRACKNFSLNFPEEAMEATESVMATEYIPFFNTLHADERTWRNTEQTWRLELPDLRLSLPRGVSFPYVRKLSMVLNPTTNLLFKLSSQWPAGVPAIKPLPSALEEEKQMLQAKERFTALPDVVMPVDFETALKKIQEEGPAMPNSAKQLVAYHTVHTTVRYSDRPVWIIHTRGIIPFLPKFPPGLNTVSRENYISEDARNHLRHVVDAITGEWLFSDTTPQPTD